jgi:hypothetical protein
LKGILGEGCSCGGKRGGKVLDMLDCIDESVATGALIKAVYINLSQIPGRFSWCRRSIRWWDMVLLKAYVVRITVYWREGRGLTAWWCAVWLNGNRRQLTLLKRR